VFFSIAIQVPEYSSWLPGCCQVILNVFFLSCFYAVARGLFVVAEVLSVGFFSLLYRCQNVLLVTRVV